MVEALGITIDRLPKRRPIKRESSTKEKIGCVTILILFFYLKPYLKPNQEQSTSQNMPIW